MARPRQFDEERALDAVMRTFWEYGYEAASTQDLCDATGLGRSSIYNTFRSKRELFARSLARYLDTMADAQEAVLDDVSRPPGERVRALLDKIVADEFDHRPDGRSLGCLAVNSTVELAAREPEVARLLDRDAARRLSSLSGVIAAGLRDGSITSGRGPDALARYVNAVIGGMRIAAQGGADRAAVQTVADTALDALIR
ncbi:TetR/AcrR family transcriptional regulator [Streptomyces sp. SP18CM02]|uniref:TetR/AcrR family transcriptional regulator n=1 Tax=Streptomyces sp. SP18CM02 TaxID=2758571 RepID=UPI00168BADD8|nr:TetR/AcrR family transcriptional regulator [Streptomyces sp. SP18CM02]MBD3551113.1 TetR/AcrR family transcriptional regulator [Streptomyces sp. SP18CM02]